MVTTRMWKSCLTRRTTVAAGLTYYLTTRFIPTSGYLEYADSKFSEWTQDEVEEFSAQKRAGHVDETAYEDEKIEDDTKEVDIKSDLAIVNVVPA